jgi:3-oxoacyl-[acyl-carrier protein] reductase
MDKLLKNKVAIVTGATAGIGKAIALNFAQHGAKVAVLGTNPERGAEVVREIQQLTGDTESAVFCQVDIANTNAVDAIMNQLLAQFGKVDILVNNAGITRDALLMKMTEEQWDSVVDVNLKSAFNTCRAVVRSMMKARKGKIINISSVVGLTGNPGQAHYAASKSGLIGFSKSLAKELASRNICVNCIAPGFIQTRMTDVLAEAQKEALLKEIPLGRMGWPEEIAHAALFLASDWSDYVTGQVMTVDGGMVM